MSSKSLIFISIIAIFISCKKEELEGFCVIENPIGNKEYHFNDTINVIGTYSKNGLSERSDYQIYIIKAEIESSDSVIFEKTIYNSDTHTGAFHEKFINKFSDTTNVILRVYEAPFNSYESENEEGKISSRKIICLPN